MRLGAIALVSSRGVLADSRHGGAGACQPRDGSGGRWIGVRVKTERIDTERLRRSLTAYLCGEPTRVAALLREQHDLGERRPRKLLRENLHFDSNLASKYQNAT